MIVPPNVRRRIWGKPRPRPFTLILLAALWLTAAGIPLGDLAGAAGATPPGGAPPALLALFDGTPQNWSPYSPSPPIQGTTSVQAISAVAVSSLPNTVVNQTGTLTIWLNGTWNPAPATAPDRDWVAIFIVRGGQADFATVEANASVSFLVDPGSIPFSCYFGLPSPIGFSGSTSSAIVTILTPDGNSTQRALTAVSAGIDLTGSKTIPALPTKSVWFNASGDYIASAPVAVPVDFVVVAPLGGLLPFATRAGVVHQWVGNATFPGARAFIFTPLSIGGGGPIKVATWTRGSPESGLFVNSSLGPVQAFRGDNATVAGTLGNRSLVQSTSWSVNTSAAAPRGHDRENCTSAVRLQNGSWRLFCTFESYGAPNSTYGVDSAFSQDGRLWAWEPGVRFELCGGYHTFTQLSIVRTLAGGLRMYYGGSDPFLLCLLGSTTHISSALSTDEGVTWTLEAETLGSFGVSNPDLRAVVPSPDGWSRMYLDSASGLVTARSPDGVAWTYDAPVSAATPRSVYLLTDGSYKLYAGTTSVTSQRSLDGVSWDAPQLEVAPWAGDIEAGPLLDRGDGQLQMLLYSQADGLFVATLAPGSGAPTTLALPGRLSDGSSFSGTTGQAAAGGSFAVSAALPPGAPLGRFSLAAQPWFGGLALRGVILNRAPAWVGPATLAAAEDVPLTLDLALWVVDGDPADALVFKATTGFGSLSGSVLTLVYPNAVLSERINGTVTDGLDPRAFTFLVTVTAVNDPPAWLAAPPIVGLTEDTPFSIDLAPWVSDEENATASLSFTENSPYGSLAGSQLQLLYPEGVLGDSFTLTVSDGLSVVPILVSLAVTSVNDPPTLVGFPPPYFNGSGPLIYAFAATDAESVSGFTFYLVGGPTWLGVSPDGQLVMAPPVGLHGRYDYTVAVRDADGLSSAPRAFVIVMPANRLPVMTPDFSELLASAILARPFVLYFNVTDADNDTLFLSAAWDDLRQSVALRHLGGFAWSFEWTPDYPGPRASPFEAWLNGTLTINDSFDVTRHPFAIRVLEPPSRPPVINGTIGPIRGAPGQTVTIDLTPFMTDPDEFDTPAVLSWSFEGDVTAVANYLYDNLTHRVTFVFLALGNGTLVFRLSDPGNLEASQIVLVQSVLVPITPPVETGFPWWAVLLAAAGLAGVIAYRRVRPGPAAVPAQRRPFLVEDVFLLSRDGRTIFMRSGLGSDAAPDPDLMGAMLVAVQDFIRDSLKRGEIVDRMGYGDSIILLARGAHTELAVTVFGEPDPEFREMMAEAVANVEGHFAGVVEEWSGDREDFDGVEAFLAPLWQHTAGLTRADVALAATKREVQFLSGIEFFQGFVRVKVAAVNNTQATITNVAIDLDYNTNVLRLQRVEPATYKSAGSRVLLGTLKANEKGTLAYYFDPQVCTTSLIDGTCRYREPSGRQRVVEMKQRTAEVVCPLFFTPVQANTAMLRRLIETEAREYDVRAYSFPKGTPDAQLSAVFDGLKSAVLAHDVQQVRSFAKHNPFVAEAWFYGATQGKGYPVVVRAAVDKTMTRAEFFVASVSMRAITGLIAELHHTLKETPAARLGNVALAPLFDEHTRRAYADPTAVSKMVEGEATPQETDPGPEAEPQKR